MYRPLGNRYGSIKEEQGGNYGFGGTPHQICDYKKLAAKTAYHMHNAAVKSLKGYPAKLRKSITYDNGTENSLHEITNKVLQSQS